MTPTLPSVGDAYTVTERTGYRPPQNRPYNCQSGCACGACAGTVTEHLGTVTDVLYFADNSIEARVLCADGTTRTAYLVAAHGDVCF